ncbi:hypothetical protein [Alicyclobacillus ferrooxydans]|uniref:hypothetical protein n=1 Tax=Alicyclobacillus ferrooxydans TaxID=471514 RepID=UPI0006D59734|nr:hypothetical protein [Alicyclobacillus ferrooxydans]
MKAPAAGRDTLKFKQKDFDMVKEGVVSLAIAGVLIVGVAAIWGAPYRPAVTNQQIATQNPVLVEQTALGDLAGTGAIATYGPPYNNGNQSIQSIGPFHPQTWWGTPYQIQTANADVLTPLSMLANASHNTALQTALYTYDHATGAQQQKWDTNLNNALNKAKAVNGNVVIPQGDYGPVSTMMNYELSLAKSGMLSGTLDRETNNGVYRYNVQNDLLFLQGSALHQVAGNIDMLGEQWGINHDEQAYPGPWWLTPYTFLYQIPPWSTSSAGDQMAAYSVAILFLLLMLVPWVPGLNKLPRLLRVHRVIWRDWYKKLEQENDCANCPLRSECSKEFKGVKRVAARPGFVPACYQHA